MQRQSFRSLRQRRISDNACYDILQTRWASAHAGVPPVGCSREVSWRSWLGAQLGVLMDAALLNEVGGVEGPGGALVVLGEGGVEGGAVEEEVEAGLAGGAGAVVGEAVEDVFEDKAVVCDQEDGDGAG